MLDSTISSPRKTSPRLFSDFSMISSYTMDSIVYAQTKLLVESFT